jgi:hypothetical protein
VAIRSSVGRIEFKASGVVALVVPDFGARNFASAVEARDEAVRLSLLVQSTRQGIEREGFSSHLISDAGILCALGSDALEGD